MKILFVTLSIFFLFSCAQNISKYENTCKETYDYFPDAEICLNRQFSKIAIQSVSNEILMTIHAEIISILKNKIYSSKIANEEAWFEYDDMFSKFSISEDKILILETYLRTLKR